MQVRELRDELGQASFAPALLVVALLIVTPLSGIPGFTTFAGLTIAFVCGQYIAGRRTIWLPGFILRQPLSRSKLKGAAAWLATPLRLLDRAASANRLGLLTRWPASAMLYGFCMVLGLAMPLLEFVPMTSSLLGIVVAAIAAGLVTRDGLFAALGLSLFAAMVLAVATAASALFAG